MLRAIPLLSALALLICSTSQATAALVSSARASLPPATSENASTAFLNDGSESRIWLLCHNDPVNKADPLGLYGRGFGWNDKQWKDFQRKQEGAIRQIDHRLADMTKQNFEKQFGKGAATPENMARKAAELTKMRDALKDNGARGYYANAVTNAFMKSVGNPSATGLTYSSDRQSIYLNVDTGFSQNALKHESAHNAGLIDVRVHGHSAYLNGSPDQQRAFYGLPLSNPAGALLNADTLANYAR